MPAGSPPHPYSDGEEVCRANQMQDSRLPGASEDGRFISYNWKAYFRELDAGIRSGKGFTQTL